MRTLSRGRAPFQSPDSEAADRRNREHGEHCKRAAPSIQDDEHLARKLNQMKEARRCEAPCHADE
jgi:hypothetical protein